MGKRPYRWERPTSFIWHGGERGAIRWRRSLPGGEYALLKSNNDILISTQFCEEEQASALHHEIHHGSLSPVHTADPNSGIEETIVLTIERNQQVSIRRNPDAWHWMIDAIAGRLTEDSKPPPAPPAPVATVVKEEARRRAPVKRQAPSKAKRSPKKAPRKRGR